jgi:hypothetical protein
MARRAIELIGGEPALERIADMLFVELFPDHEFAPLFEGLASTEILEDLRALLRVLFADTPVEAGSELVGLCSVFTDRPLGSARRLRLARLFVDCLVEAQVPPTVTLAALDRLYTVLHQGIREDGTLAGVSRWSTPRLRVV